MCPQVTRTFAIERRVSFVEADHDADPAFAAHCAAGIEQYLDRTGDDLQRFDRDIGLG